jgi:hypothetical protein
MIELGQQIYYGYIGIKREGRNKYFQIFFEAQKLSPPRLGLGGLCFIFLLL